MKEDPEAQNALNPFYELVGFLEKNKNRKDRNRVREEAAKVIQNCKGPDSVKKQMFERREDIMGSMFEEISFEDRLITREKKDEKKETRR